MKKLACRLGRHDWTTHVERGETYKVCAVCGKTPPDSASPGSRERFGGAADEPATDKPTFPSGGPGP
jgi:hypothetical protein